jgi:chemotaxis protein methyltransferase CheR
MMANKSINYEQIEMDLLIEGIRRRYGYDFSHYAPSSLHRRLQQARQEARAENFSALLERILHDEKMFDRLLKNMSITVTEMFRDPGFYKALRSRIIPLLKTYPYVKIWHAGCATGEEAYSMAMLLHEENFLGRVRIYATDFNKGALDKAQQGIYPAAALLKGEENYLQSGGRGKFSSYFSSCYDLAKVKDFLKERITFSYHNLVTDGVFGEMNIICCRNVMIYFDPVLKDRVLDLFTHSLHHGGYLCLGNKESLSFSNAARYYEAIDKNEKIYKKSGAPRDV